MRGMGRGHHRGRSSRSGDDDSTERLRITDRRMLGWFVQQLGPHWPKVLVGATAMVLGSLAGLAPPFITGRLIVDGVMRDQQYHLLPGYIGLLIGAFFAATLLNGIRMNVMHILGQRFVYELRVNLYEHLQRLSLSYFESNETGDIMSRVSNDVNTVEDMVVHGTDEVVSNILTIAGTVIILMYMNWRLALAGLWPLPIFVVSLLIFARYIRPLYRKIRDDLGDINAELWNQRREGLRAGGVRARKISQLEPRVLPGQRAGHLAVDDILPVHWVSHLVEQRGSVVVRGRPVNCGQFCGFSWRHRDVSWLPDALLRASRWADSHL